MADWAFCDVPIPHLRLVWPLACPHLMRALDREGSGRYLPEDILRALLDAKARLWVAWNVRESTIDAAVVTETIDFPRKRELRIWLVGGRNMRGWVKAAEEMIEAFARAEGCAFLTGSMRRGWLRVGTGFRETGITFEKAL